ncbi:MULTISPECIES: biotin-dependent carboxyltransferase family protein [Deefgea]|uniref:5-oxoprolinase/urea amidolyase family protein n=1 Tax=Deefgea chitinilytica TaxID=570276 RepID=A0ABS2C9S7_9NEIS|nr:MULTISPECIES: biotin-dependent carboxyltransferase family protein [Deefgea]MBM5570909.1 5-oxoprolinase/urea amidolyase family protein [Deefgea chitinilytica]MBM9888138.1 biotin-dependent carboxyltransferase family protein [Deefgea sp. CFH1-16]
MNGGLVVIRAGVQSTVQDLGRRQAAQWGVPQAGAADPLSLALANLLLGNAPDAAAVEVTLGGAQFRFVAATDFALAGADCAAHLDGKPLLPYSRQRAQAGQLLQLSPPAHGARTYLALLGGIDVPLVLGSRSTLLAAQLGGVAGRALQAGDVLHAKANSTIGLPSLAIVPPSWRPVLRLMRGPQWGNLSTEAQSRLQKQTWQVSHQSDRMGLKLLGDKLQMAIPIEMASQAVFFGTMQLPPSGLPILLLADAQTTGGYPIVGQLIQADLWRAGQYRANDQIQFQIVDADKAVLALRAQQNWLRKIQRIVCSSI